MMVFSGGARGGGARLSLSSPSSLGGSSLHTGLRRRYNLAYHLPPDGLCSDIHQVIV